jgi:hypothetical protein
MTRHLDTLTLYFRACIPIQLQVALARGFGSSWRRV